MTSPSPIFLYRNWFDDATLSASSQATSVNRVKEMRPSRRWSSTGDTAEYILADCGADKPHTHIAVVGHNLTAAGTIRARVADNSAMTSPAYDSGVVDAWDPVSGFGSDGFGYSLGGYPILSEFADFRAYKMFDLAGTKNGRYVRLDFADAANPDTQIRVGWAFAGLGAQPAIGMDYGWGLDWVDPSEQIETEESLLVRRRRPYRVLRMALSNLAEGEAYNAFDDLKRIVARSRSMLVVPFPAANAAIRYRTTVYGVAPENPGLRNPFVDLFATEIVVRELPA